jgi:hypothetical protein
MALALLQLRMRLSAGADLYHTLGTKATHKNLRRCCSVHLLRSPVVRAWRRQGCFRYTAGYRQETMAVFSAFLTEGRVCCVA